MEQESFYRLKREKKMCMIINLKWEFPSASKKKKNEAVVKGGIM